METACSASVMFRSKAGSCDEPEALHSIRRNVFYVGVCGGICGSLDFPSAMLELGYFAGSEMRFDCASLLLYLLEQPRWLLQDGVCAQRAYGWCSTAGNYMRPVSMICLRAL